MIGAQQLSARLPAAAALASTALLCACAHSPTYDPQDPLEKVNRAVYGFNVTADKYALRPVARVYADYLPSPVRTGVGNFLSNLSYPTVIVNDLLQGKLKQAGRDTGRFLMNSTFGLAGLLDPATMVGLTRNDEDFGQTLGKWGVGPGWYLMLPLLGPTTNRDFIGTLGDAVTEPSSYVKVETRVVLLAADVIDTRADLLSVDSVLAQQFDPYIFVRSAYLQNRRSLVHDGNPPPEDDFWDDDEEAPAE